VGEEEGTHLGDKLRGEVVEERDESPPLEGEADIGIRGRVPADLGGLCNSKGMISASL